jgi:inward rectifier potassium channel
MAPVNPNQIINRDGTLAIKRVGTDFDIRKDTYHFIMSRPWWQVMILLAVCYIGVGSLYALVYLLGGDCIQGARPGNFLDYYYFSIQTLATIGYGTLTPKGNYANLVVSSEAFVGLMSFAMMSGLMFAKFSVPNARVTFSDSLLISQRDGKKALVFRVANARGNQIIEAHINVTLARIEPTESDPNFRRLHKLPLVVADSPLFVLTFVLTHIIDEHSPLYGMLLEQMIDGNYTFMVTLMGQDSLVSQTVHARHGYDARDIVWGHRFIDTMLTLEDGSRVLDLGKFHQTEALPDFAWPSGASGRDG